MPEEFPNQTEFSRFEVANELTTIEALDRDEWIETVCAKFVHGSQANRTYYRLVLETLWSPGQALPGPVVSMQALRAVINNYRGKPYSDLARRIRELQGEEGVVGIQRTGSGLHTKYQLLHTRLEPKRVPRTGLNDEDWTRVLIAYKYRCAVCGRSSTEMRLDQDHKRPRLRGGGDELSNWQPLCKECNNFKSTACRYCNLDCASCPWAFPEHHAPVRLSAENIERIRSTALKIDQDPSSVLNEIVDHYFDVT